MRKFFPPRRYDANSEGQQPAVSHGWPARAARGPCRADDSGKIGRERPRNTFGASSTDTVRRVFERGGPHNDTTNQEGVAPGSKRCYSKIAAGPTNELGANDGQVMPARKWPWCHGHQPATLALSCPVHLARKLAQTSTAEVAARPQCLHANGSRSVAWDEKSSSDKLFVVSSSCRCTHASGCLRAGCMPRQGYVVGCERWRSGGSEPALSGSYARVDLLTSAWSYQDARAAHGRIPARPWLLARQGGPARAASSSTTTKGMAPLTTWSSARRKMLRASLRRWTA